jgi:hypothetical protein
MDMPFAMPAVNVTGPDGRINQDINCIKCGYNLRTLLLEGRCPECGVAVGRSVLGDFLRYRDPEWVGTLASGMNWIVAAIVLNFVIGCAAGGIGGALTVRSGSPQSMMAIMLLVQMIGQILYLVGYWKVTTPDPAGIDQEPPVNARKLVRFTAVLSFVLTLINAGLTQTPAGLAPPAATAGTTLTALLAVVMGINGLVFFFAVFTYFRRMALRIPNEGLARHTLIVMWGIVISMAVGIVAGVTGALSVAGTAGGPGGAPGAAPTGMMMTGACAAGVGLIVFGIWSLILIGRYQKGFRQAAADALATWALPAPVAQSTQ